MSPRFDVVIVGCNILAKTTAYFLNALDGNLKVAVVGPAEAKGTATRAAGAMLGHFGEVTKDTLASEAGLAKFEMSHKAAKLWAAWVERINNELPSGKPKLQYRKGTYVIHNASSGYLDTHNYLALKQALAKYEEPYEEVDPTQVAGLNPVANHRPLGVIYLPNEGFLNPLAVLDALDSILKTRKNIHIVDDTVCQIKADEIKTLELGSGSKYQASTVLIAAGAFSQQLLDCIPQLKHKIPRLVYGVGCAMLLEQPATDSCNSLDSVIRTINRAGSCGLHLVPRSSSTHYVGATNNVAFAPETLLVISPINALLTAAVEQLNRDYHAAKIQEYFVGNRPVTLDTFPLLGETSIKGLWIMSGTYRDGFHLSPAICQSMAEEILGRARCFDEIFKPERPLIQTMSKEAAIEEAAMQYVSSTYEHGIKLPNSGWHDTFLEMNRKLVIEIYDKLECDEALSPDLIFPYDTDLETHIRHLKQYLNDLKSNQEIGPGSLTHA